MNHKKITALVRIFALLFTAALLVSTTFPALAVASLASRTEAEMAYDFYTKLSVGDGATDDAFGSAVAIDGDTVVVGAFGENSNQGSVYIHKRDQGGIDNWGLLQEITASDGAADNFFGTSVALDGDTLIVGAYGAATGGA